MGVFEVPPFAKGTIARSLTPWPKIPARFRIVGGGDTVAAVKAPAWPTRSRTSRPAAARRWSFWKAKLPGVEALTEKK